MAIEKQPLSLVPDSQEEIELEITQQPAEETEVFIQPDGSVILGSDMPDESSTKFGENLAEYLSDGDLDVISRDLVEAYEGDSDSREEW